MKKNVKIAAIGSAFVLLLAQGCATTARPVVNNDHEQSDPDEQKIEKLSGKVIETANGGGYTYVCLEKDGKKTWAAIPTTEVKVGQQLDLLPGGEMNNFPSKALGRTFDKIIFSGGIVGAQTKAPATPAAQSTAKDSDKPVLAGKIIETMDAGGYTYICLEKDGKKGWSAVPLTKVKVGDEIELLPGAEMGQFSSPTLKRTFNNIYFSGGVKGGEKAEKAAQDEKAAKETAKEEAKAAAAKAHGATGPRKGAALPPGHDQSVKPPQAVEGKVVETMNSGGYTYVCLEKAGKKTWLAAPTMKVAVGDSLSFQPGMEMSNFTSKSLNRSFEKIIFTNGLMSK